MADHEIVWTFDSRGWQVQADARCNAASDAACRNMPTCACEEWNDEQRDDDGWFHLAEEYVTTDTFSDDTVEVKHRHDRPSDCNICTWLNESDILECTGSFSLELAVTPIKPVWVSPGYDWEPAEQIGIEAGPNTTKETTKQ